MDALLTMRVASAFDVPLRSWIVDVAAIFHPKSEWPERVRRLQTPGVGERMLKASREAQPDETQSTASRLLGAGVPRDLAQTMAKAHDEIRAEASSTFTAPRFPISPRTGGAT